MTNAIHPVRAWRKAQDPEVTLDDLAERLDRKPATVSRWETWKRSPDAADLIKLHQETGISYEVLVQASQPPAPVAEAAE